MDSVMEASVASDRRQLRAGVALNVPTCRLTGLIRPICKLKSTISRLSTYVDRQHGVR